MSGEVETITCADLRVPNHTGLKIAPFVGVTNAIVRDYQSRNVATQAAWRFSRLHAPMRFVSRTLKDGRHVVIANPEGI